MPGRATTIAIAPLERCVPRSHRTSPATASSASIPVVPFPESVLWGLVPDGQGRYTVADMLDIGYNSSSLAQGAEGELYLLDPGGGIYRINAG